MPWDADTYTTRDLPASLLELADEQRGLLTLRQLHDAGVTRSTVRWRLTRGWTSPLPGVIQVRAGHLDALARAQAALLYAGPGAVLGGSIAASVYGIGQADIDVVDIVVPRTHSTRSVRWVVIRRTDVPDRPRLRDGLRVVSVERAVIDTARWAPDPRTAEAVVIEACQRRLTTPGELWRALAILGPVDGVQVVRRALALAESGAWSVAESDLSALVARSRRLPTPLLNPRLTVFGRRLTTPDLWFDDVALAVMVHSKAHHLIGQDWDTTVSGDADLVAAGVTVLGVTPSSIRRHPERILARVEAAYDAAARRPRPPGLRSYPLAWRSA